MRNHFSCILLKLATAGLVTAGAGTFSVSAESPLTDYSEAIRQLDPAVREQMDQYGIQGVAIALVDDQRTVHAEGYGLAQKESIFRCGSISKLFNAIAVMQLVEAGQLDLDTPIQQYYPDFSIVVPFADSAPITLRQLLCHRSGMVRETPVGGYLDNSEPSLKKSVESLRSCVLVNPANTKTRYSNVGPSIAGQIVSVISGLSYEAYQQAHVLDPLGMESSSYLLKGVPRHRVVDSFMRVADGRGGFTRGKAPLFNLGTIPAGNLFTTVEDLARFISMLAADGRANGQPIISPESLAQMFTPQLVENETGFGLGFFAGQFREHRTVQHFGAVYGFTSALIYLPESRIGVVILSNEDIVTGPVRSLADLALAGMLEAKLGEKSSEAMKPFPLSPSDLARYAGDYESESYWAQLEVSQGVLSANISGQPVKLLATAPRKFVAKGRLESNTPVQFELDERGSISHFTLGQKFTRVTPDARTIPDAWKKYLGSYGHAFAPIVISERHGHLYAMTENMVDYRLAPLNRHVFALPNGMYVDEHLVFLANTRGKPQAINFANMVLKRR